MQEIKPKISVIMVDGHYRPHFGIIDSLGKQTMPVDDFEVLWIEYFSTLKSELVNKTTSLFNYHMITLDKTGVYHSSYCFNEGIRQAKGDLLVIVDADVILEEDFLERVWKAHQDNDSLVMYVFRYDEVQKPESKCLDLEHLRKYCVLRNASNYGGCLTVRKSRILEINGYEQLDVFRTGGNHANGLDVYTRFKNLGMQVMWHPQLRIYHPWHPTNPEARELYRPQIGFISSRALGLDILPYMGLDPDRDRKLPQHLVLKFGDAGS